MEENNQQSVQSQPAPLNQNTSAAQPNAPVEKKGWKQNLPKILGVILIICGAIIFVGWIESQKTMDLLEAGFMLVFGILLIFRGKIG